VHGQVDRYRPFFWQEPTDQEFQHLHIAAQRNVDSFANERVFFIRKQRVSDNGGSVF
jgi:hypothetical protein